MTMRILAIDHGTKHVGLALGDTKSSIVTMLPSFASSGDRSVVQHVAKVAAKEGVETVVVGMPAALDGSGGGAAAERVKVFISGLEKIVSVPVTTEDERLTTAFVERLRKDAGVHAKHFDKDSAAAVAIAESFIGRLKRNKLPR